MPEFARLVLDALPLTVYTTDLEGRITSANRAWSQFAQENGAPGIAPENAVCGQSMWSAFADPSYSVQLRDAMQLIKSGRVPRVSWEFPCSSPDEERIFLLQIAPVRDEQHAISGFVFCTVDITPSHRSREALIDAGLAIARTIDLDRVFQEVALQVRRVTKAEWVGIWLQGERGGDAPTLAYTHGAPPERSAEQLSHWLADVATSGSVTTRTEGTSTEIAAPMQVGMTTIGAMGLVADRMLAREEREEVERVLATLAAQTAAAVDRTRLVKRVGHKRRLEAVGEVATGIAHELRNPLFGISSAAQLLRFRAREDAVVEKNVGRILREVERLNRMVTSLLEFGRPRPTVLAPGDPEVVLDDVLEGQRGLFDSKHLELARAKGFPVECLIDEEQLAQVFLNLLLNAADHAPAGTTVRVVSGVVEGRWQATITNGGPPIAPDSLPRVFELFYSTKAGGTGIGLALCQRMIEEHKGELTIESTAAAGTSVTVSLPIALR